jgi:adenosylcobinamide-GDP ribazoletransferase
MGVAGIVSMLLLKFCLLANLPQGLLWKVLILTPVFSRWAQVLACYGASYAREEGKAKYFIEYATKEALAVGFLFTVALFCLFLQLKGLVLFSLSVLPVFLLLCYIKKRIGGMTGDTIGALSESAEVLVLLFAFLIK